MSGYKLGWDTVFASAAITAFIGLAVTGRSLVGLGPVGRQAAFVCQHGDGWASCIPILRRHGGLDMVSVDRHGGLGNNMQHGDRLVILNPGMEFVEPEWVSYGKGSERPEFNLHGNETIPVLMADGTLALVTGKGSYLSASGIRRIAPSANPTQPQLIVDAAVAAAR